MIAAARPRVAPSAIVLVYAILLTGFAAAYRTAPVLWLATPIVAWIVLRAGVREARATSATIPSLDIREFPAPLRDRVRGTFAQLPEGDGRRLLLAVVNQARLVFARGDSRFDPSEDARLRDHVAGLVDACCATAADLARLDQFELQLPAGDQESGADLAARAAKGRDLFRARLTSAAAAVAELYAANIEQGTPSTDRVAELTAAISEDAKARSAATDEMRRLLG
jgi:hypothetical protein